MWNFLGMGNIKIHIYDIATLVIIKQFKRKNQNLINVETASIALQYAVIIV